MWLLGTILTINIAIAGFLWRQIEALRKDHADRAAEWTEILNRHMHVEEKEFDRLRDLQVTFAILNEKALKYVSREDLEHSLAPICAKIDRMERMMDARNKPNAAGGYPSEDRRQSGDPVSGRG